MTILAAKTQLAAKLEAEEGTAETLAAADALLVAKPVFNPNTAMGDRDAVSASMSPFARVPGARFATMEFDVEVKGSGTAGTAPALGKLLKACGFGEDVEAGVSVSYEPASSSISSMTLAFYMDGVCKKIWGARGNVSLRLEDGLPGWFHFIFTGADFSVADGAMLSGVSYESTEPPAFLNASLTIDSYAALLGLLEINMNNTVALRQSVNKESGYLSAAISKRVPSMSIDPEMVTVATYDFYGKLRSGNQGALSAAVGATAGNICTLTAPKVQYTAIAPGEKEGIRTLGIECALNRNTGDDEVKLVFT